MPDSPLDLPASPPAAVPAVAPAAREQVIARLQDGFARDQLSLDEFERRVAATYGAATPVALASLTADLPAQATIPSPPAAVPWRIAALFGNVERGGLLTVPAHLEVRAFFGNVELDLRRAHFAPGVTEIALRAVMGNIEIQLPAQVQVENEGSSVLASFECRGRPRNILDAPAGTPTGAPVSVVRLTGRMVLSSVTVTNA